MNRRLCQVLLCCLLTLSAAGCVRTKPLENPTFSISAANNRTVEDAIINSLRTRGWLLENKVPGMITASYGKGAKHSATVRITYSKSTVNISLLQSSNLLQGTDEKTGQPVIHRRYLTWIKNLENDIQQHLSYAR